MSLPKCTCRPNFGFHKLFASKALAVRQFTQSLQFNTKNRFAPASFLTNDVKRTAPFIFQNFYENMHFHVTASSPPGGIITIQKQPFIGVLRKRCYENMQQIYKRAPIPECNFNKVAYLNHTSAWVFSYKFAAYSQNIFS